MPEVFCNTSPLQYLYQSGFLHLLPSLYGHVAIPDAVAAEIDFGRQRGVDLPELTKLSWLEIRTIPRNLWLPIHGDLDTGEMAVLALAKQIVGSLAIIDDGLARYYARLSGIRVTGTCGVLLRAKRKDLVTTVEPILNRLTDLGFFLDDRTRMAILKLAGEPS
jgi:uncharacterized protein